MAIIQCCSETQFKFITCTGDAAQDNNIKTAKKQSKNALIARFVRLRTELKKETYSRQE